MILRKNSTGNVVEELQKVLGIPKTGVFDNQTEEVVEFYQGMFQLPRDKVVGPMTWKALLSSFTPIAPVDRSIEMFEDASDPEEEMEVQLVKESFQDCKNILELIKLINGTTYIRDVQNIIYHCTATHPNATVSAIKRYWKNKLGWNHPGYHLIIKYDGSWTYLQDFNYPSNGARGYNHNSIHVAWIGGVDKSGNILDNISPEQMTIMEHAYKLFSAVLPNANHFGHNKVSNKACPVISIEDMIKRATV